MGQLSTPHVSFEESFTAQNCPLWMNVWLNHSSVNPNHEQKGDGLT